MTEDALRLEIRPEIRDFVDRLRGRLSDLSGEEREELVGGLEADLEELVADGGCVAELGDPRAYADELRAAAGVPRQQRLPRARGAMGTATHDLLDTARRRWHELTRTAVLAEPWAVALTLRPLWWVLRAWVAVQLLAAFTGHGNHLVPRFAGPTIGLGVLFLAIVGSVQLGRGRLWLTADRTRPASLRVTLVALNVFAVLMLPLALALVSVSPPVAHPDPNAAAPPGGLAVDGEPVTNVFAYDLEGEPLTGVQLYDQDGEPLQVGTANRRHWRGDRVVISYPWINGRQRLWNVFPLPTVNHPARSYEPPLSDAWTTATPPVLPVHPLAVVPPVALPERSNGAVERGG